MLTKKIEEALNDQITKEAYASNYYLAMASWCDNAGLQGSAGFMYEQSLEEREHMMKIVKYVNEAGGHALAPQIKQPSNKYKSIAHVFESALKHEIEVTKSINKLVELSLNSKDYTSFNFLQWFVEEQLEEENLFRGILDMVKLTGTEGRGVFLIDKEISKFRKAE